MSIFEVDGKRYFRDSHGAYRECNKTPDLGVNHVPTAEDRQIRPTTAVSGTAQGGFGNTSPNACDDPEYVRRFHPAMTGTDGEPIQHAGSANHPLNSSRGWLSDKPYRPTRLPHEIVAEQNAIAAAELAAAEEESQ